jgi:hypothetical protein
MRMQQLGAPGLAAVAIAAVALVAMCGGENGTTVTPAGGGSGARPACAETIGDGFVVGASDGVFVYGFGGGALERMAIAGGAVERLVEVPEGSRLETLALDDAAVYWVELGESNQHVPGHVWRAPKTGGAATALATSVMPVSLALADDAVFFTDRFGGVYRVSKAGGAAASELVPNQLLDDHVAGGTALDATFVYFAWSSFADHRLRRVPRAGGAVEDVAALPSFSFAVAAAGGALFIGGGAESDGVVRRVDPATGAVADVFASEPANAFAVDSGFVYVATDAHILRVRTDGSDAHVLADAGGRAIAVAGGLAYFGAIARTCP